MEVAIVDYSVGNVANLGYALERTGYKPILTADAKRLAEADIVILPGVGAAAPAMEALRATGLIPTLQERVDKGKLFLGICLGMQLLYERSKEDGDHECLGFLQGTVEPFVTDLKVPHMGWNELVFRQDSPWQTGLGEHPYVYYVHSYLKQPALGDDVLAISDYGQPVPGLVGHGKLWGFQFHPEKSGAVGEQLLKNMKLFI